MSAPFDNVITHTDFGGARHAQQRRFAFGNAASLRCKQVARIIQHLRNELKTAFPQLKMPSYEMISYLTYNAFTDHVDHQDGWQSLVIEVLKTIREQTNVGLDSHCPFTLLDGKTPLFPNNELFDEWDAFRFSQALLHYLEKELN